MYSPHTHAATQTRLEPDARHARDVRKVEADADEQEGGRGGRGAQDEGRAGGGGQEQRHERARPVPVQPRVVPGLGRGGRGGRGVGPVQVPAPEGGRGHRGGERADPFARARSMSGWSCRADPMVFKHGWFCMLYSTYTVAIGRIDGTPLVV